MESKTFGKPRSSSLLGSFLGSMTKVQGSNLSKSFYYFLFFNLVLIYADFETSLLTNYKHFTKRVLTQIKIIWLAIWMFWFQKIWWKMDTCRVRLPVLHPVLFRLNQVWYWLEVKTISFRMNWYSFGKKRLGWKRLLYVQKL